ncbi:putative lysine-specific histone demethylase Aof2 [Talaromyces proteolyticus]|uniref:Lysine-specific histone demethylase Aof2 n=1 Tax=Talaromyces proteolyticus TaxID=1131652 RepID=A0AAD4Q111_9EURO|nr:putative lysine-specific histone demethylase Aof2 [Talaromyces proteolyticus]KAH8697773.1 putative lysine-specific histone demethylase Aof2 [Talaromyces proteolyticus]
MANGHGDSGNSRINRSTATSLTFKHYTYPAIPAPQQDQIPASKRRRIADPSDRFVYQNGINGLEKSNSCIQLQHQNQIPSGSALGSAFSFSSQSAATDRTYRDDFESEASNYNTPNTSTSVFSSISQKKSTSPSALLIAGLESTTTATPKQSAINQELEAETEPPNYEQFKPRSSIPSGLPGPVYAQQCITAAISSRLDPFALHIGEQKALENHLCHLHVTAYLNIRNGILRLWTRNPMISVTREEALGCAKDFKWMGLADFAYEWLVRKGYINFGCVEVPQAIVPPKKGRRKYDGPVIVIIGAGVAGLACARQLDGLYQQYRDKIGSLKVIVLEGRRRIGGRIYSHPLKSHKNTLLPNGLRPTAEMGAHIIVGFDKGNPLDPIIRSQLALRCHLLRDISTIYDIDGSAVDEIQDAMDERLYNDVLDRSGNYRHKAAIKPTAEGDRDTILHGRDITVSDGVTVQQYEEARAAGTHNLLLPAARFRRGIGHNASRILPPPSSQISDLAPDEELPAAMECQSMGWRLLDGISPRDDLNLDAIAKTSSKQTLGAVMDEGVKQYQRMLPLTPKDMRLLNWHYANLEYANATNLNRLSLSGWDQDMGNEFEGEHSQIIGGYQQVPRGLWSLPTKLDVRTNETVTKITYDSTGTAKNHKTIVHTENGPITADHVVYTGSLGTLKHHDVEFSPPLPDWKTGAIDRLGFGVLNKVVLVFDQVFWDSNRDMFGLLRDTDVPGSMSQPDYARNRGRFYLFWNCVKTAGIPLLIALMAGDAAHQAESLSDTEIVAEVTAELRNIFKSTPVPDPLETIVTRWKSDRFTRGTYSFVAADALPGDYDLVAKDVGNLHFAGEATCGTHPATVHGAFLSGLRVAADIIEKVLGPIVVQKPLVPVKEGEIIQPVYGNGLGSGTKSTINNHTYKKSTTPTSKPKAKPTPKPATIASTTTASTAPPPEPIPREQQLHANALETYLTKTLGPIPVKPPKIALNPFLTFQKDYWIRAKQACETQKRESTKDPQAKAARDEIRAVLGQMWREADEETKRPYHDQMTINRQTNTEVLEAWKGQMDVYTARREEERRKWEEQNPFEKWVEENVS